MKIYRVLENDSPIVYFRSFKKAAEYIHMSVDFKRGGYKLHEHDYGQDWIQVYFENGVLQNLTDKEFNKTLKENYHWKEKEFPFDWLSLDYVETED